MSSSQSNLSKDIYQYDLVVGTTAKAINATMKKWLTNLGGENMSKSLTFIYQEKRQKGKKPETTQMSLSDYNELVNESKIDPTNLEMKTYEEDDEAVAAFMKAAIKKNREEKSTTYFKYLVKLDIGIPKPKGKNIKTFPKYIPDLVEFSGNSKDTVKFTLQFSTCTIIQLDYDADYGSTLSIEKTKQANITDYIKEAKKLDSSAKNYDEELRKCWGESFGLSAQYMVNLNLRSEQ